MRTFVVMAGGVASLASAGLAGYSYMNNVPKEQQISIIQNITQQIPAESEKPKVSAIESDRKTKDNQTDLVSEEELTNRLEDIKKELVSKRQVMNSLSRQMAGDNKNKVDSVAVLWNCGSCGKERTAARGHHPRKCFYCGGCSFVRQAVDAKMSSDTRYQLTCQLKAIDGEIKQLHLDSAVVRERLATVRKNRPQQDDDGE